MKRKDTSTHVPDHAAGNPVATRELNGAPSPHAGSDREAPVGLSAPQAKEPFEVGYGRPPLHSRFKPGQFGNPRGRAKQSRNMRTIIDQVLNEDMQIREGDTLRRMSALEALVRTTLRRCYKDPKAMITLMTMIKHVGYGADRDDTSAELLSVSDYQAIVDDYFARNAPSGKAAAEIGTAAETLEPLTEGGSEADDPE